MKETRQTTKNLWVLQELLQTFIDRQEEMDEEFPGMNVPAYVSMTEVRTVLDRSDVKFG